VSHVVQFELPDVPEQYVHRIGRTARAGKDGSAIAFCAEDERSLLRDIERVTRQKIPSADRRNDPVLAQLSANASMDEKRGAKAEPRGEPQQRRNDMGEQNKGRTRRRRRQGQVGAPSREQVHARNDGQKQQRQQQPNVRQQQQKPRGQKQPHRKGPSHRDQAPARGDVMKVSAGAVTGPVPSASDLMRRLAAQN